MKSYSSYKDSGVKWIGDIPDDWIKSKIKYETIVPVQYGINTSSESYIESGIRFIRTKDINDNGQLSKGGVFLKDELIEETYKTKINDLLISRSGTLGRTYHHKIKDEFTYGGYLVRFNFGNHIKTSFIYYFSKTGNFNDWIKLNTIQSTIGNVNGQKYSNLPIPLPPKETQSQIVSFLDTKTQKIDDLIEKTEQKIELLKEKRTSLINTTVTKGLNPNVEMKDSGVEWIGEIPRKWNLISLKHLVSTKITDGPHETPEFVDEGIPFLSVESVQDNKLDFNRKRGFIKVETHKEYSKKCKPQRDDVFLVKSGSTTGKSTIVETDEEFNIWSPLCIIRSDKSKVTPRFTFTSLQSFYFRRFVELGWSFGTQPNIGMGVIENIRIIVPPLPEQKQIVSFLDTKTQKIDSTIEKETQRIELLKEYRQSLISEVVTGKIDVRD